MAKVESPHKTKHEEWKALQAEWLEERDMKRGKSPINKEFFNWLFLEYRNTKDPDIERIVLQIYHYMIRSTIFSPSYAQTSHRQKEEFISQAYLYFYDGAIERYDPKKGSSAFNYLLTIIKGAITYVIAKEQDVLKKEMAVQKGITSKTLSENSELSSVVVNKPAVPNIIKDLTARKSCYEPNELDALDIEVENLLFEERLKTTLNNLKPDNVIDIAIIKDYKIVRFADDLQFRKKPFFVQYAVFYITHEKVNELALKPDVTIVNSDGVFVPYEKLPSKKLKTQNIKHYDKLCVVEFIDSDVINENNGMLKTDLTYRSIFSRVDGFDYFCLYKHELKSEGAKETALRKMLRDSIAKNAILDPSKIDLSKDVVNKDIFNVSPNTHMVFTEEFLTKWKIEHLFDIINIDTGEVVAKNQTTNKKWIDLVLSDDSKNYTRVYKAGRLIKV